MLWRALLAAIAISYLICVLYLSGIQKEDLDVGLLKRLEKYHIEPDDLKDEEVRKECRTVPKSKEEIDLRGSDKGDTTTKVYSTTTDESITIDAKELESILKYLKNKKKIRTPGKIKTNIIKEMQNVENTTTSQVINIKTTSNRSISYDSLIPNQTSPQTEKPLIWGSNIESFDGNNYLESKNKSHTTLPIDVHEIERKIASSIDAINKLSENIAKLQNNINKVKTDSANKSSGLNINLPKQLFAKGVVILEREAVQNLAKSLAVTAKPSTLKVSDGREASKVKTNNRNTPTLQNDDKNFKYNQNQMQYTLVAHKVPYHVNKNLLNMNPYKPSELNPRVIDIQNIVIAPQSTPTHELSLDQEDSRNYGYNSKAMELPLNPREVNFSQTINKSNDSHEPNKNVQSPITFEMINKIAENVKEIVLKDLKVKMLMNLSSTSQYPSTASTPPPKAIQSTRPITTKEIITTESITMQSLATSELNVRNLTTTDLRPITAAYNNLASLTNTPTNEITTNPSKIDQSKVQSVAARAIEKFLELFEQIKTTHEKSVYNREKKVEFPRRVVPRQQLPSATDFIFPSVLPVTVSAPPKTMPVIIEHFIPSKMTHPVFPPCLVPIHTKSMINVPSQSKCEQQHILPNPIMIQSNTREFEPLGLINPEAMNPNIIVTTAHPFWTKEKKERWDLMYKYGRNPDNRDDIKTKERLNDYANAQNVQNIPNYQSIPYLQKNTQTITHFTDNIHDNKIRNDIFTQLQLNMKRNNAVQFMSTVDEMNKESIINQLLLQGPRYGEHETSRYPTSNVQPKITIPSNANFRNYLNPDNNYKYSQTSPMSQFFKTNTPFERVGPYNAYSESVMNSNINYGRLQNGYVPNQIYQQRSPETIITRPGDIKTRNYPENIRFSPARNMEGRLNQNDNLNTAPEHLENIDLSENTGMDRFDDPYARENFKSINNMMNPIQDNEEKYSRINFYNRNEYNNRPDYQKHTPLEYNNEPSSDFRASYTRPREFMNEPNQIKVTFHNLKEQDSSKPLLHKPLSSDHLRDKVNIKFGNTDNIYNSPSKEVSNHEFIKDEINHKVVRPLHEIEQNIRPIHIPRIRQNIYSRHEDKTQTYQEMMGHRDKFQTNFEHEYRFDKDRNNFERHENRQQTESSDSEYKHNPNVQGFHKKLEGSESWPESPSDCEADEHCASSISVNKFRSRQQIPIEGKKKYDDTHFKNILNTQQKVNQMLEMILSSKADGLHSAEPL